jgi:hypothetical protein
MRCHGALMHVGAVSAASRGCIGRGRFVRAQTRDHGERHATDSRARDPTPNSDPASAPSARKAALALKPMGLAARSSLGAWARKPTSRTRSAPCSSSARASPSSPRCTSSATRSSWRIGKAGSPGTGGPASMPRMRKTNASEGFDRNRKREARASLFSCRSECLFGGCRLGHHAALLATDLGPDLDVLRLF